MFGRTGFRDAFREMEEDPFFAGTRNHMRSVDDMFRDPFRGMGMLEDGRGQDKGRDRREGRREPSTEISPFGGFGLNFSSMFGNMDKMMKDMDKAFAEASRSGNGQMFQQSSFMSYNKSGEGPPKVFQASSSTRTGPGGVRETRKALRDSERELEKMAVGHHIYDRGHEKEKHRNTRSGQIEEMQNFHNLEERDAEAFDREWQEKTRTAFKGLDYGDRPHGRRGDRHELRDRPDREPRRREEQLALPAPESDRRSDRRSEHWGRTPDRRERDRS